MRKVIYYVAMSLDGYIVGPEDDISMFTAQGEGVERYLSDLKDFDTVIMGRKTYEFGYKYGLTPGQPAYSHMKHFVFSRTLQLPELNEMVKIVKPDPDLIKRLKCQEGSDIYLCGGGILAGCLLEQYMIDELKIKLNPIILGDGIPLFGDSKASFHLKQLDLQSYPDINIIHYSIQYDHN